MIRQGLSRPSLQPFTSAFFKSNTVARLGWSPAQSHQGQILKLSRRFWSPSSTSTLGSYTGKRNIVAGIIGVNVGVTLLWAFAQADAAQRPPKFKLRNYLTRNFVTSLAHIREGYYWTVLTSAISQASPFHLLGNMITFWAFSSVLLASPFITTAQLTTLCVGSALTGSFGWIWYQMSRNVNGGALGASGMVAGVGSAAACIAPRQPMMLMGIIPAPLWLFVIGYSLLDSYFLDRRSNVGHAAHLSGYAFGAIYYLLALRRGKLQFARGL